MNNIHKSVIIEENVIIGDNNTILPNTIIYGPTQVGDDNIIGPNVVIGTPGQDTKNPRYDFSCCKIIIGNRNIIREFTAIQKPCYEDITIIGDDVFLMQSVHIPHDAHIYNKTVITPMCVLGGITKVLEGANLGMGCTINQYTIIGQYSIVATGAAVMKNVIPFSKYIPGKKPSVNYYAIEKFGFTDYIEEIEAYVLRDIYPKSDRIVKIIDEFDCWVSKYNNDTYK